MIKRSWILFASGLLSACSYLPSVGPEYVAPEVQTPPQFFSLNSTVDSTSEKTSVPPEQMPFNDSTIVNWWQRFNSTELTQLIEKATENNKDLKTALSRVAEARALQGIEAAGFYPQIDSSAQFSRNKPSTQAALAGFESTNSTNSAVGIRNQYQAAFDSSWELDFFGGTRRAFEAASAEVSAQQENYNDVLLILQAEVARNYVQLKSLYKRVAIAKSNVEIQADSLNVVQSRFDAGLTNELDVVQAKAQLENTKAVVPALESEAMQAQFRLAVLIARNPGELADLIDPASSELPQFPAAIESGVPSELLRKRPDLRKAERAVAAATARVGVATADLFPRITLGSSFGFASRESDNLFEQASRFWSLVPGLHWPIFEGGKIHFNIEASRQREQQALLNYQQAVLLALEETENTLTRLSKEKIRQLALQRSFESSKRALILSKDLYQQGLIDFLRVIEAERTSFIAEDQVVQSQTNMILNSIALFKALGG